MLPEEDFAWTDPIHIREVAVNTFYKHVIDGEKKATEGEPWRFRFSHYKTTVDGKATWLPALYPDNIEDIQPRRRRKAAVRGPALLTSPDDDHSPPPSPKPNSQTPAAPPGRP